MKKDSSIVGIAPKLYLIVADQHDNILMFIEALHNPAQWHSSGTIKIQTLDLEG